MASVLNDFWKEHKVMVLEGSDCRRPRMPGIKTKAAGKEKAMCYHAGIPCLATFKFCNVNRTLV